MIKAHVLELDSAKLMIIEGPDMVAWIDVTQDTYMMSVQDYCATTGKREGASEKALYNYCHAEGIPCGVIRNDGDKSDALVNTDTGRVVVNVPLLNRLQPVIV